MTNEKNLEQYTPTIGIECHVQLKTRTKLFAAVENDAREAAPNTLVSQICFGLPGALPVLNRAAVELACKAAYALGTKPQKFSQFDRKHYFYPDLPKGYQITQFNFPIIVGGLVVINVDGQPKKVGITKAHLEEDAGKSVHPTGKNYSLVDLNRAGTPLLEIVSEPDMHSSSEARAFARELYLRMKYADVSEANLYYGNMRFDVNVSVSNQPGQLGVRSETKNLNSFKSVEKAVEYEIKRQIELLKKGQKVIQETRGWDDAKQKTFSQRDKENAHDYRYFPDPDLPPIHLTEDYIEQIGQEIPMMPEDWRKKLLRIGVEQSQVELLLDAEVDDSQTGYLSLIESTKNNTAFMGTLVNWIINVEIPLRRSDAELAVQYDQSRLSAYQAIYELIEANQLSSTNAKKLIEDLLRQESLPHNIAQFALQKGYIQVSDEKELGEAIKKVVAANSAAVEDVKNGELKAIGFLVGQVMKETKGKANPELTQKMIKQMLGL